MTLAERLAACDVRAFNWVAGAHGRWSDATLPRLTRAADHGLLWWAVAAGLGATRGQRRRGAVRGVLALSIASAVANIPAKLAVRRERPPLTEVPLIRRLQRQPGSTSFPSGHSASAAAFAVGVAMEAPLAGAAVGVLSCAVAYSRVYVGVHYPGDVLAGVTLGAGCALLTAKTWPRRPAGPARAASASSRAPSLPGGRGMVIVVNANAGKASRGGIVDQLHSFLPDADIVEPGEDDDLIEVMTRAAEGAQALGVAGGDGTVNVAAAAALAAGIALAVFPAGTLDHFARDVGLDNSADTAAAVEAGLAAAVDVGWIEGDPDHPEGSIFLNTASLGSYPELVEVREKLEDYLGKWPAVALGAIRVLRRGKALDLDVDGQERRVWLIFVGNGGYRPAGFAPTYRPNLDDGLLDVRLLDAQSPFTRTRLVLALVSGRLGKSRVYEQRYADSLHVRSRDPGGEAGSLPLARDGEVGDHPPELVLRKYPKRLVVYRPTG